ncbi:maleate cis-trans isomerase family protein [Tropicimonas marinistellae]|uniref:maleate cis-trans isomerase family protein n=1 Tax=Tropicimonas marinistellae TaxID=1739787 RepID=UPI000830C75A|nr:hypothetical protein [Tropicimonas marinistellae]
MALGEIFFDNGGAGIRIGLIVLSTDMTTENGFRAALVGQDVSYHTTRVLTVNPLTEDNLRKMGPQLAECAARLLPEMPLDVIAYSCTSATVALGFETVAKQIRAGRPGIPVTTPATAALNAFAHLERQRIALFTPYPEPVGKMMAGFLAEHGVDVVKQTHLGIESDADMPFVSLESLTSLALNADHPDADALFISCTAIRAMEVLEALENELGKPCMSSIQCLLWDSLRVSGHNKPIVGFGRLLSTPATE